jgi:hypothetical protein
MHITDDSMLASLQAIRGVLPAGSRQVRGAQFFAFRSFISFFVVIHNIPPGFRWIGFK